MDRITIYSTLIFSLIALVFGGWLMLALTRSRRAARLRKLTRPDERRCKCGYLLEGLEMPRCPECGRVIGFDATFEELGIAEAEVRRHIEQKRDQRLQD